jgi:dephospho-CoA kinase
VLARLAQLGAETIDADRVVHELMAPDEAVWSAVRDAWPEVITAAGEIDRRALGVIVFADPVQLRRLEALTHPAVRARIVAQVADAARRGVKVVVVDAIKLFEGGLAAHCDTVWVVTCTPAQQLARLMARNGFSEAEARQRIAAQPQQAEKVARANVVIDNSGSRAATLAQVDAAWAILTPRLPGYPRSGSRIPSPVTTGEGTGERSAPGVRVDGDEGRKEW